MHVTWLLITVSIFFQFLICKCVISNGKGYILLEVNKRWSLLIGSLGTCMNKRMINMCLTNRVLQRKQHERVLEGRKLLFNLFLPTIQLTRLIKHQSHIVSFVIFFTFLFFGSVDWGQLYGPLFSFKSISFFVFQLNFRLTRAQVCTDKQFNSN